MSDMRIPEIGAGRYNPLGRPIGPQPSGADFTETLKSALGSANDLQLGAGPPMQQLLSGENVDLHEVMISSAEAGIAFDLMMEIRNKLVDAYQEIQRMNV
ncbi:MAG: flagellar hook-basal body complex protein FliE [Gemmatimonadota bacterium]|nr:MAG: flagellar hook-basal body complex protein FliE [Gemmatimonadota bacterium]